MAKKHPNKVGRVGPKHKDKSEKKVQISGPYMFQNDIDALGGKEVVTQKIHNFAKSLKP